eukprot:1185550-Pyramimonas_sp.AAC.1
MSVRVRHAVKNRRSLRQRRVDVIEAAGQVTGACNCREVVGYARGDGGLEPEQLPDRVCRLDPGGPET